MIRKPIFNPFIAGGPVPPEQFFGRENDVRAVLGAVVNGQGSVAIHGEQRIGKTSLLHYLRSGYVKEEWQISGDDFTFIFFDCAGVSGRNREYRENFWRTVLAELESEVGNQAVKEQIEAQIRRGEPTTLGLQEFFREVAKLKHRVVILLDEFENVVESDAGLLRELRAFVGEKDISLVVATHGPLKQVVGRIDLGGGVTFDRPFYTLELKPFNKAETMRLVEERLKGQTDSKGEPIRFGPKDLGFIWEISRGHPYKIQFACYKLYENYLFAE